MMSIFSMTPYKRNDVSNYFDDFEKAFFGNMPELASFRTDVLDKGDSYVLEAELPGFKKEDIDISLEGDVLTVSASHEEKNEEKKNGQYLRRERRFGSYKRSFDVSGIDVEHIGAAYNNGILELTLPKQAEAPASNKKIDIQ